MVINCDSLTEINLNVAKKYISKILKSKYFLSINHESNKFTVNSLITNNKFIEVNGIVYPIVMLNENKQTSKTLDHKINNVNTSNAGSFSPSNDHPFKRASFEKMQAKKQNKRKVY